MRGSQFALPRRTLPPGIIPAHAGLTKIPQKCPLLPRDHPRACGAHFGRCRKRVVEGGSSPRMRGSQVQHAIKNGFIGIIPAHAGLTPGVPQNHPDSGDHPRACGAHYNRHETQRRRAGIIPAHAGLTFHVTSALCRSRDHPRACGAHKKGRIYDLYGWGSSPRMRGSPPPHRTQ